MSPAARRLVTPAVEHLDSYVRALEAGWSSNNEVDVSARELAAIRDDPTGFLAAMDDREAAGPPVDMPDGTTVPRLPGIVRWIWDDGFCGRIGFRWQKGTAELPPHCLGHIGYAVVHWRRGRGHATWALGRMLDEARAMAMPHVELTTTPDNVASRRVMEAHGARLVERFEKPAAYGGGAALRFRIAL